MWTRHTGSTAVTLDGGGDGVRRRSGGHKRAQGGRRDRGDPYRLDDDDEQRRERPAASSGSTAVTTFRRRTAATEGWPGFFSLLRCRGGQWHWLGATEAAASSGWNHGGARMAMAVVLRATVRSGEGGKRKKSTLATGIQTDFLLGWKKKKTGGYDIDLWLLATLDLQEGNRIDFARKRAGKKKEEWAERERGLFLIRPEKEKGIFNYFSE